MSVKDSLTENILLHAFTLLNNFEITFHLILTTTICAPLQLVLKAFFLQCFLMMMMTPPLHYYYYYVACTIVISRENLIKIHKILRACKNVKGKKIMNMK